MKLKLLLALVIASLGGCSAQDPAAVVDATAAGAGTTDYANARFGFHISVPKELVPQGESDNGDGQAFLSRDGKAEVRAYGSWLMEPEIKCAANAFLQEGSRITYERTVGNASIVSGMLRDQIFYRKVIRTKNRCLTLDMTYPATDKAAYDSTVNTLSAAFEG